MTGQIIDIHTHAFPDTIAEKAMDALVSGLKDKSEAVLPARDGTVQSLKESMASCSIGKSVLQNIATKPGQFQPIMEWSKTILDDAIIPFTSIHPSSSTSVEEVQKTADAGIKGIKLHPYYQEFDLDDTVLDPFFREIEMQGLILLLHAGFDIAFDHLEIASPERILRLKERFPGIPVIAAHLGGWMDWERSAETLIGKEIYLDTSYALKSAGNDLILDFLNNHPEDYLLFGTDSPWRSQKKDLQEIGSYGIEEKRLEKILWKNADRLLFSDTIDSNKR